MISQGKTTRHNKEVTLFFKAYYGYCKTNETLRPQIHETEHIKLILKRRDKIIAKIYGKRFRLKRIYGPKGSNTSRRFKLKKCKTSFMNLEPYMEDK